MPLPSPSPAATTIPVFRPLIEQEEFDAVREALELGWLGMGSYVAEFERSLQQYLGAPDRHVVAVSTGHAALHLGLLLAGAGPGTEVITPSFNNIADFQAIIATGAEPVFCDIDARTLCLDVDHAASLISPRTRVILTMDYGCHLSDFAGVSRLARAHGIRVMHDAAHSFGSMHEGRMIGSFSDICMFSFDPIKTITCIDGGALVVRSQEEVDRLHAMRLIGMAQPASVMYQNARAWTYDVTDVGYRYHMANLHAAMGVAQLQKMDRISASRRAACEHYNARLSTVDGVEVPPTDFGGVTPFIYYVRVGENERDDFRAYLADNGVDTGLHWQPGHWMTLFKGCRQGTLEVTEQVGRQIVTLPLHSCMPLEVVDRICDTVVSYFDRNSRR